MRLNFTKLFSFCLLISSTNATAQWSDKSFAFQGNTRQYRVYKPASYNANNPASLVITLHGLGDNMTNFSGIGMNTIADTANIIVVVPQAMPDQLAGTAWNSGVGYIGYYPNSNVDDVAFISALIDTISSTYSINQNRVYACGFSMGGFMTERLAIELNNKIAAFASVAGTFGFGLPSYNPDKKVNIAHFHGTADNTVPYTGNTSGISADSLINFWVSNNVCNTTAIHTNLPDIQNDGYTVEHFLYSGGQNNTEVELFKVNGAGHTWLTANNDISYTAEIWKFFRKHQVSATSIQQGSLKNENVTVYPNPASDKVVIKLPTNNSEKYTVTLSDMTGKIIRSTVLDERAQLLLNDLHPGIYFICISSKTNGSVTKKITIN